MIDINTVHPRRTLKRKVLINVEEILRNTETKNSNQVDEIPRNTASFSQYVQQQKYDLTLALYTYLTVILVLLWTIGMVSAKTGMPVCPGD